MLTSGMVPALYPDDEKESVLSSVRIGDIFHFLIHLNEGRCTFNDVLLSLYSVETFPSVNENPSKFFQSYKKTQNLASFYPFWIQFPWNGQSWFQYL